MDDAIAFTLLESVADQAAGMVGSGIEMFGLLIIVAGIGWSTYLHLRRPMAGEDTEIYKIRIGRSLLLGLEVLVAADIVKTIAHELSFISLGLLAGLVLVRYTLSNVGEWFKPSPSFFDVISSVSSNMPRSPSWR